MEFEKNRVTDNGKFLVLHGEKLKALGDDHDHFTVNYVPEEREERLKVLKEMYIGYGGNPRLIDWDNLIIM